VERFANGGGGVWLERLWPDKRKSLAFMKIFNIAYEVRRLQVSSYRKSGGLRYLLEQ
jgi:hypothetical protein